MMFYPMDDLNPTNTRFAKVWTSQVTLPDGNCRPTPSPGGTIQIELWLGERAEGDTYQCDTYSHALAYGTNYSESVLQLVRLRVTLTLSRTCGDEIMSSSMIA